MSESKQSSVPDDQKGRQSVHSQEEHQAYWSLSDRMKQAFVRDSYAQRDATDPYATSRDVSMRELEIASILRNLPSSPGARVMDLGCGNGVTLLRLASSVAHEFLGVDFSENLLSGARTLSERWASSLEVTPEFVCADAIAHLASTPDGSWDAVITERFLQNLPSRDVQMQVVTEIARVLKPGGRALLCEGSGRGFDGLNELREQMGLDRIPATSADNITAIRLEDDDLEGHCAGLGLTMAAKEGYSSFFMMARVLHPLLVAPEKPRFDAKINDFARRIQEHAPFTPGIGGNTLWVFQRPA